MSGLFADSGTCARLDFDEVVVADTETTGLSPYGLRDGILVADPSGPDRLCSAAFIRLRRTADGWVRGRGISLTCNPGRPVPEFAARINGFHWSGDGTPVPQGRIDLSGECLFENVAAWIVDEFIGDRPLVFHNAVFDGAVIDAELERAGLPPLDVPILCTKKAFSDIRGLGRPETYLPGTNLNALCDMIGIDRTARVAPDGKEMHGAVVDASMAADCFQALERLGWMIAEDPRSLPHRRDGSPEERIRRALAMGSQIWGGMQEAGSYLWRPHPLLDMRRPVELVAEDEAGLERVETELGRLRYGIPA